jgi:hypothetical protein
MGPFFDARRAAIIDRQVRLHLTLATTTIVSHVVPLAPKNLGHLAQSIGARVERVTAGTRVGWTGTVASRLKSVYPLVMERGRAPGSRMPPVEAIAFWAQRKLRLSVVEARRAAFLIARAIARKGIRARRYFERGGAAALPTVRIIMNRMVAAIAAELNRR